MYNCPNIFFSQSAGNGAWTLLILHIAFMKVEERKNVRMCFEDINLGINKYYFYIYILY